MQSGVLAQLCRPGALGLLLGRAVQGDGVVHFSKIDGRVLGACSLGCWCGCCFGGLGSRARLCQIDGGTLRGMQLGALVQVLYWGYLGLCWRFFLNGGHRSFVKIHVHQPGLRFPV